ncbi:putative quinol monooxygenase [Ilumatobacter sp.]|uniref:putative quinol monooxygenase n=1 Tax=Ilumatobacter sp. TaxID=1967498 RepID=UPI003C689A8C
MIAIIGYIEVEPDERDGLVASVAELQRSTENDEPGCLTYAICADPANPARIRITELWESAEALDGHFQHPNFRAAGAAFGTVTPTGGSIAKYRIDASDDVRGPDGNVTSTFHS